MPNIFMTTTKDSLSLAALHRTWGGGSTSARHKGVQMVWAGDELSWGKQKLSNIAKSHAILEQKMPLWMQHRGILRTLPNSNILLLAAPCSSNTKLEFFILEKFTFDLEFGHFY